MEKVRKLKKKKKTRSYVAGLFDVQERHATLSLLGDPLVGLKAMIDWEAFREILRRRERGRVSGRARAPLAPSRSMLC